MVTRVKSPQTSAQAFGRGLADQLSRILPGVANMGQAQAQQNALNEYGDYLESIGLDRNIMNQPDFIQKEAIKQALKPKTAMQSLASYFTGGPSPASAQNEIRQAVEGAKPKFNEVSKEEADRLRAEGYNIPLPNGPTSLGQRLGSFGTGLLEGAGSISQPFLPQTLVSGGLGLTNLLGKAFGAEENIVPSYENLQESGRNFTQGLVDKIIQSAGSKEMGEFYNKAKENFPIPEPLEKISGIIPPTASQVIELGKELLKGTGLEKYVIPQTTTQQDWEKYGNVMSLLSNPTKAFAKGGTVGAIKNIARAAGFTLGGDVAGWMTEHATGSKNAGDLVRNGTWIFANLFPGTLSKIAGDKYAKVDELLDQATNKGVTVNLSKAESELGKLSNQIKQLAPGEAKTWLENELFLARDIADKNNFAPKAFNSYLKDLGDRLYNAPDQAKGLGKNIDSIMTDSLYGTLNQTAKGGAELLKDADRIYKSSKDVAKWGKNLKDSITGNLMIGPAILMSGGYKKLLSLGAGAIAGKYVSKMLGDPAVRSIMHQLFKASAANNTALTDKLMKKLDQRTKQLDPKSYKELGSILNAR